MSVLKTGFISCIFCYCMQEGAACKPSQIAFSHQPQSFQGTWGGGSRCHEAAGNKAAGNQVPQAEGKEGNLCWWFPWQSDNQSDLHTGPREGASISWWSCASHLPLSPRSAGHCLPKVQLPEMIPSEFLSWITVLPWWHLESPIRIHTDLDIGHCPSCHTCLQPTRPRTTQHSRIQSCNEQSWEKKLLKLLWVFHLHSNHTSSVPWYASILYFLLEWNSSTSTTCMQHKSHCQCFYKFWSWFEASLLLKMTPVDSLTITSFTCTFKGDDSSILA